MLKRFGKLCFDQVAYFNFDLQPELKQLFTASREPARILEKLSLVFGRKILPQTTLLILDEIQECNDALNSLKYFEETAPEYAIATAGSLLGVALARGSSFPVGKVDFLTLHPLSFAEFLSAAEPELHAYLESITKIEPLPDLFFNRLLEKLRLFFICGGMPESVTTLLETGNVDLTQSVLQNILNSYMLDFSKHVENRDVGKIKFIWDSVPSQLARDNRKFLYQAVRTGARAREYEDALNWLVNAGLCTRVFCITKPSLPVSAYDDLTSFKLYLNDAGLLRRMSNLDPTAIREGNRLLTEFKGALTENFILSGLSASFDGVPRYWKSGNIAEVDFILQYRDRIIPVEVKSDENIKSRSLTLFRKQFEPEISIRFSLRNFNFTEGLINIPVFMVDYTKRWIDHVIR